MNYKNFIQDEVKDRLSQKGMHKAIWNFIMFPFTTLMNLYHFRKWISLLDKLNLDISDLKEKIPVEVEVDEIPLQDFFKHFRASQHSLRFNECYLIEKNELFIFPYLNPDGSNRFFTEIEVPLVISLSKNKHPYETLWKTPTLTKIQNIEHSQCTTTIVLKGVPYENRIKLKLNKIVKHLN